MDVLITLCLIGVVAPAWILYMLPKAIAGPVDLEDPKKRPAEGQEGAGEQQGEAEGEETPEGAADGQAAEAEAKPEAAGPKAFCNACGSQFEEGAQFCQNCGNKRNTEEPSGSPPAAASTGGGGAKGGGKAAASGGKG